MVESHTIQKFVGKTILIVDDDESLRSGLALALSFEEYSVLEASSGKSALKVLDEHPVNLVVSDIEMPDGDGFFLLKEIQSRENTPPLVFISAHSEITPDSVKSLGAVGLIRKPFDLEKLLLTISSLLIAKK